MKTKQTTYTFSSKVAGLVFKAWLKRNIMDRDYGNPLFISSRQSGKDEWTVEYSYEKDFARGVATGIEEMGMAIVKGIDTSPVEFNEWPS